MSSYDGLSPSVTIAAYESQFLRISFFQSAPHDLPSFVVSPFTELNGSRSHGSE